MTEETIRRVQIATIRRLVADAADRREDAGPAWRRVAARSLLDAARWRRALATGDPVGA